MIQFLKTNIALAAVAEQPTRAGQLLINIQTHIISPVIGFFMVLATIVFIWGIVEMIMGADSEDKRTQGKQHMIWGIIGLFIMIAAGGIISILCQFVGLNSTCA